MNLKRFGKHKIYKGLLSVEAVYEEVDKVVALALTKEAWFGRKEILRYWNLDQPVSLDIIRKRKWSLDELFGGGRPYKDISTKSREERRK